MGGLKERNWGVLLLSYGIKVWWRGGFLMCVFVLWWVKFGLVGGC